MKRFSILAIAASIASIFLLCMLGVFIFREQQSLTESSQDIANPFETDEGLIEAMEKVNTPISGEDMQRLLDGLPGSASAGEAENADSAGIMDHQIIFVGDSRTLGCRDAIYKTERDDDCIFVGKVGEGCAWFMEEGIFMMEQAIKENPGLPVVLNFGVNDPDQISQYQNAYTYMMELFPDTDFYFLSVNPVEEDKMEEMELNVELINNETVSLLNKAVQSSWPEKYIDSWTMLRKNGFETVDGIHYTEECYLTIHDFVVKELSRMK